MAIYYVRCTASADIGEKWRVEAGSPEEAIAALQKDESADYEFVEQFFVDNEHDRRDFEATLADDEHKANANRLFSKVTQAELACLKLREARELLKVAGASVRSIDKVRLALKSAEGAVRAASVRRARDAHETTKADTSARYGPRSAPTRRTAIPCPTAPPSARYGAR